MSHHFNLIEPEQLKDNPFHLIGKDWMLITAGTLGSHETYNTMTASWGGLGILWHKPVSYVFVRPSRHTFEFIEAGEFYTLSVFEPAYRDSLMVCGTKSGRDGNKVAEARLTPLEIQPAAVTFEEARLAVVCRKMYAQDLDPARFLDPDIETHYPKKDYHRMYVGEVVGVYTKD